MRKLRIGVNALYLIPGGVGGTEIYLRSLLAALAAIDQRHEYIIFTNRETGPDLVPEAPNFRNAATGVRASNRPIRLLWEQVRLPGAGLREGLDVLFNPGFTSPMFCRYPGATVFHDLQHLRHPKYFRFWERPFWNRFLEQSARTSDLLIAVSQQTAEDLDYFYDGVGKKTRVIHHGVDERLFGIGWEPSPADPFLLCVSTLHPHKNIRRLVRVFGEFHRQRPGWRLVLAGVRGYDARPVERLVVKLGLAESIRITGWIPRDELYELYRKAHAFVYPSTFEGFGMLVLEALAAGVPTCCSDIPPLREVAGEMVVFFDPASDNDLLGALKKVTGDEDLRERLGREGRERARGFSWTECARATLKALEEASEY